MSNKFFFWTVSCSVAGGFLFNTVRDTYNLKFENFKPVNSGFFEMFMNYYFNWGTMGGFSIGLLRWYNDKPLLY
jgi:hypothetical protein